MTNYANTPPSSDTDSDVRAQDQQLFNFVAITLTVMDLAYFALIYLTSIDPWLSLGIAVLMPGLNVPAVKLEARTGRALIAYTLPLSLIPMFFVTYVSGVNSPAWFMTFGAITATSIIYPFKKLKIPLICSFIGCALLGTWMAGAGILHLAIIGVTLGTISAVLTRVFAFLETQKHFLRNEITERKQAEEELRKSQKTMQALLSSF